jgi:hypothetical protein
MLRYFLIPVLLLATCLAAAPAYAGCSNPTGNEADRIYNKAYHTLQFCNGTNWVPFGAYNPYVGPGDIVSGATAWYGLRAYNLAYTTGTNKAINIRRASDNTTMDIVILTSGALDTSTAATFCASTTCYVDEWYDQTGNGNNVTQSTNSNQPTISFNCIGSLPCVGYSSTTMRLSGSIPSVSQPLTMSAVAERTGNTSNANGIISTYTGSQPTLYFQSTTNTIVIYASNSWVTATANDNAWHAIQGVFNAGTSVLSIDGISMTGSMVGTATSTSLNIGNNPSQNVGLTGNIGEAGLWPSGFSTQQQSNMCHNQYTYWGTSTAC